MINHDQSEEIRIGTSKKLDHEERRFKKLLPEKILMLHCTSCSFVSQNRNHTSIARITVTNILTQCLNSDEEKERCKEMRQHETSMLSIKSQISKFRMYKMSIWHLSEQNINLSTRRKCTKI